jgi:hypothetical protein
MAQDQGHRGDQSARNDVRNCPKSSDSISISQNEPNSNVRKNPNPSDAKSISQNEPKLDGARNDAGSACPEMSANVRDRPIQNPKAQNEPTAGATTTPPPIDPALKLSPRQLEAINLLFAGKSFNAVSAQLGVDPRTLYRWRQTPAFAAEVRRRYRERAVARKPLNRGIPLIPPATPSTLAQQLSEESHRRETAYWRSVVQPGHPLPPPREDEPLWVKEIRKCRVEIDRLQKASPRRT